MTPCDNFVCTLRFPGMGSRIFFYNQIYIIGYRIELLLLDAADIVTLLPETF